MLFFILQSLFWFLLFFFAGLFLGKWLKQLLCKYKHGNRVPTTSENTDKHLDKNRADDIVKDDDATTLYVKTNPSQTPSKTTASDAYEAMLKKSSENPANKPEDSTSFNANIATGATTATFTTAAYSAHYRAHTDAKNPDIEKTSSQAKDIDTNDINHQSDQNTTLDTIMPVSHEKIAPLQDDDHTVLHTNPRTLSPETEAHTQSNHTATDQDDDHTVLHTSPQTLRTETETHTQSDHTATDQQVIDKTDSHTTSNTLGIATGIAGAAGILTTSKAKTTPDKDAEHAEPKQLTSRTVTNEKQEGQKKKEADQEKVQPIDTHHFDQLQIIEGIGATMEQLLYTNGIGTWKKLSLQSNSDLRALLDQEDSKYKGIQTEGWIEQAKLAASGKFTDLVCLQKTDGQSKVERKFSHLLSKKTSSHQDEDDLQLVIGIGPKVMELLNDAGIYTFKELSHTSIERLQQILDDGGANFRITDPKTWPEQAILADQQQWEQLKQYKGYLN